MAFSSNLRSLRNVAMATLLAGGMGTSMATASPQTENPLSENSASQTAGTKVLLGGNSGKRN